MFAPKLNLLILLLCNRVFVSICERRIAFGVNVTSSQSYMVYLVKADLSSKYYDFWVCGGALVTVDFIITSAACVEDVEYMYAIAGYMKMIEDPNTLDPCVTAKRKKVIFTCVPVSYKFHYNVLEEWANIDIALVKVESPFDLEDTSFLEKCSYIPTIIPINYEAKYQTAGMDTMVLGWGHNKTWRTHGNRGNYNKEYLRYAPTLIMDKEACIKEYEAYPNMTPLIENYMICTLGNGNIDENGQPIQQSEPTAAGCSSQQKLLGLPECEEENDEHIDNTRRERTGNETRSHKRKGKEFRTNGICQNDHGGPLVTWVGSSKILIGIASVFKVNRKNRCMGPYLYTSTQCNGAFLDCVLNSEELVVSKKKNRRRAELCDSPPSVKGFHTIERKISWKDHPAGPAHNELKEIRENNERNQNLAEQEKYPKVDRQPANEKYIENGRYVETANYAANTNDKYIDNGRYIDNVNLYPNENNEDNNRYSENMNYPVNANDNIARVGNPNFNDQYMIRPQRPLQE